MNKIKKTIVIVLTVLISTSYVFGQSQKATTESGKIVILNSDGTWKYNETLKTIQSNTDINDCSNWILTQIDKVDGTSTTTGKKVITVLNNTGKTCFRILIMKYLESGVVLSINAYGAGNCIDQGAKINILFTDGSRLVLSNNGKFNCEKEAILIFGGAFGKNSELEQLKSKKIQTMRVWTTNSFVQEDFTEENQTEIINVIKCITK